MRTLVIIATLALTGCSTAGILTDTGLSFVGNYTEPVMATDHKDAPKVGRACTQNYLGLVALGDGSVDAARKDGGITEVTSVDKEFLRVLGFYGRVCTVARGR